MKQLFFSAGNLLAGSTVASIVTFLMLPLITRIYEPESLGTVALYLSVQTFLVVIVTGRYTLAIPLPKRASTSEQLFWVVVVCAVFFSLLFSTAFYFSGELISDYFPKVKNLIIWLPFLGLTVCVAAIYEAVNYYLVRQKNFKIKALLAIGYAIVLTSSQLLTGLIFGGTTNNLFVAIIVWPTIYSLICIFYTIFKLSKFRIKIRVNRLLQVARYYRYLPKHLLTTGVLNAASVLMLPIALASSSGTIAVGLFTVATQLVGRPLQLFSSSIWQVTYGYLGNALDGDSSQRKMLGSIYRMTIFMFSPLLVIIYAFPEAPGLLLGKKWENISYVLQTFIVMGFFQYSSNSISYFQSFQKYSLESIVNSLLALTRLSVIMIAGMLKSDAYQLISLYCLSSAIFYLFITAYWSSYLGYGLLLPLQGLLVCFVSYIFSVICLETITSVTIKIFVVSFIYLIALIILWKKNTFGTASSE